MILKFQISDVLSDFFQIRLLLDLDKNRELDRKVPNHPLRIVDLIEIYEMLIHQLITSVELIQIKPVFKRQLESFDKFVENTKIGAYITFVA